MLTVVNPLQQQNGASLQGSASTLQGSVPQLQGAPATALYGPVAPAPKTTTTVVKKAAAPSVPIVQAPAPQAAPQTFRLGDGNSYDQNGNLVAAAPTSLAPDAPRDPGQQLATTAAQANLSVDDYLKLINGQSGVSPEEQQRIKSTLGIDSLEASLFTPAPSSEKLYQDAYAAAGLADIKSKFDALQTKINDSHAKLTEEVGTVNENPWLSEASRVGRAKRLQDLASEEINNYVNQAQQYADLYNTGLEEVNGVVTRAGTDFENNHNLNQAKLTYLEQKAQEQIAATQAENSGKLSRYLPDFLAAKAASAKPEIVTDGNGQSYQYVNGKFVPFGQPKNDAPASYKEYQLASADPNYNAYLTADANRKAVKISSGGAAGIPSATLTKVQTIANQFDGEQIVKDFNVVQGKAQTVQQIINSKLGGPGDLATVYEFMKGLDPSSVVRESEYASAAKSGNIFAGALAKFNGYLKPNGGFLPDSVKSSFESILSSKLQTAQAQYQNVYNEYGRRINKLTGQQDGTEYITDYSKAFSAAAGSGPTASKDEAINKYVP